MVLILGLLTFLTGIGEFLVEHPMVFLYRDSFGSPACPVMRLTSTLEGKLLNQGHRYRKHRKAFSRFYRRHFDLISKFNVGFKALLQQGLSKFEFYGDLVYKFRKKIKLQ